MIEEIWRVSHVSGRNCVHIGLTYLKVKTKLLRAICLELVLLDVSVKRISDHYDEWIFWFFSTGVNPTLTNDAVEWYCRMILWCDSGLIQKKGKREQVLRDWRAKLGSKTSLTPCSSDLYPLFIFMSGVLSYYWSKRVALRDNTPPNPVKLPWFAAQGKRWTHTQVCLPKCELDV